MWPNNRILLETDISFSRKESTWHAITVSGRISRQAHCRVGKTFVKLSLHSQRLNYYRAAPKTAQTNRGLQLGRTSAQSAAARHSPRRPTGGLGIGSVQHGAGGPTPSLSLCLMLCPRTRPTTCLEFKAFPCMVALLQRQSCRTRSLSTHFCPPASEDELGN